MEDQLRALQYLLDWKLPPEHDRVNLARTSGRVDVLGWKPTPGTFGFAVLEDGLDGVLERLRDPAVRCCHVFGVAVPGVVKPSTAIAYRISSAEGVQNKYSLLMNVRCEPRPADPNPEYR